MKVKLCAWANLVYSIVSLLMFLFQNGILSIPGTNADNFQSVFNVLSIIVALVGIGVIVFNFIIQKELIGINKIGCMIGLVESILTVVCILIMGNVPITCVLGVVAFIFMIIKQRK